MQAVPFDQITDPQRECLRLVLTHHNSKEIASRLGISPSAVDKRIERAVQVLGVSTRFAAARMLASYEGGSGTYDRTTSDPIDVPAAPPSGSPALPDEPWWLVRRLLGSPAAGRDGERRNRLTGWQRMVVILVLIAVIAFVTMALLNMGETVSKLAMENRPSSAR